MKLWLATFLLSSAIIILAAMKKLFRSGRTLSPWLALAVPLVWLGILMTLGSVAPHLFCAEMNPGGKEFICGARYTHAGVRLLPPELDPERMARRVVGQSAAHLR